MDFGPSMPSCTRQNQLRRVNAIGLRSSRSTVELSSLDIVCTLGWMINTSIGVLNATLTGRGTTVVQHYLQRDGVVIARTSTRMSSIHVAGEWLRNETVDS